MHLYFIPRGIRHQIEIFEKFIQTQMFAWPRFNLKTQETEISMVQGAYRDAGPFKEFVFPEECLGEVLNMLGYDPKAVYGIGSMKQFALRRIIGNGIKPIPKIIKDNENPKLALITPSKDGSNKFQYYRFIEKRGVLITFIGIKKDKYGIMKTAEGEYYQEML